MVVAIDAKRRGDGKGFSIYKNGGRVDMGMDAVEWAMRAEQLGAGEINGIKTVSATRLTISRVIALASEEAVISKKTSSSAPCNP